MLFCTTTTCVTTTYLLLPPFLIPTTAATTYRVDCHHLPVFLPPTPTATAFLATISRFTITNFTIRCDFCCVPFGARYLRR